MVLVIDGISVLANERPSSPAGRKRRVATIAVRPVKRPVSVSRSASPIAGMPALMSDREDEDRVLVTSVDDPVRKPMNQHSPMRETGRRAHVGALTDQRDGPLDFGRECPPQADHPRLVEQGGTSKLSVRLRMK